MKLIDVIKFYIGCRVQVDDNDDGVLLGAMLVPNSVNQIYWDIQTDEMREKEGQDFSMPYNDDPDDDELRIKPYLRLLSSITEEEMKEGGWSNKFNWDYYIRENKGTFHPEDFAYLLSRGFDLFGLIPAGLAINAEKGGEG